MVVSDGGHRIRKRVDLNISGHVCGESHPLSKLTWDDVELIRTLREAHGMTLRDIAEKFEVSIGCINEVCAYRTWAERPVITKTVWVKAK